MPLPAARGFTHLWARLDSRGTWPGALGHALAHCGCLGRLALSGIGWGLCRGVWGCSGSWGPGSGALPMSGWLGPGGVGGLLPLVPRGPMLMQALSGGFLCSLLGGCVVVPAVGFLGSVLRWGCLWPGSCGPLCLRLIAGRRLWIVALYTYTLITKHGYHVGPVPCVLHVYAHTHTHTHIH